MGVQTTTETRLQLGQILVALGAVSPAQVDEALAEQKRDGHKKLLGEILVAKGLCTEDQIAMALAQCYGVPYAKVSPKICDPRVIEILPRAFLEERRVLPLFKVQNILTVAVSEPTDLFLMDEIEQISGYKIQVVCTTAKDILATLGAYSPTANVFVVNDVIEEEGLHEFELVQEAPRDVDLLQETANQTSVVQLVNYVLCDAVQQNATDIHIEPDEKVLRIRYRIDGALYEKRCPPYQMHAPIIGRIKIMAQLDISEHQHPQEGSMKIMVEDRAVDMRVYIMPGCRGQRVLIRIVDPQKHLLNLESLGFTIDNLRQLRQCIHRPGGLFLITGPSGSGKSTTLHALVSERISKEVNICTLEDPLETHMEGVNQFEVNAWTNADTATVFRHILHQDPDIVMLRTIRDETTAHMAAHAALKGTLILSALHTDNICTAVYRLFDLHLAPYLVSDVLIGGLSQRLVRKICSGCKTSYDPGSHIHQVVKRLGQDISQYVRGAGCDKCRGTGFTGRIAIHELFVMDGDLRDMVGAQIGAQQLRQAAIDKGMIPMVNDGLEKVKAGIVPVEEILRVVPREME